MSDFKKCDGCGVTAEITTNDSLRLHAPVGWGLVTFQIQQKVSVPLVHRHMHDPDVAYAGLRSDGEPEMIDQGVMAQSSLDLCPDCVEKAIQGSGCVDHIRLDVTMRPYRHGLRSIPGGHKPSRPPKTD